MVSLLPVTLRKNLFFTHCTPTPCMISLVFPGTLVFSWQSPETDAHQTCSTPQRRYSPSKIFLCLIWHNSTFCVVWHAVTKILQFILEQSYSFIYFLHFLVKMSVNAVATHTNLQIWFKGIHTLNIALLLHKNFHDFLHKKIKGFFFSVRIFQFFVNLANFYVIGYSTLLVSRSVVISMKSVIF